jgi:hypothetical protein
MSNRLPRRLFVTLGWVVILVVGIGYSLTSIMLFLGASQMSFELFASSSLRLQGGAVITLVLTIVIGVPIYAIARAQNDGRASAIATSLLLLVSLLLFLAIVFGRGAATKDPHALRTPIARLAAATPVRTGGHVGK